MKWIVCIAVIFQIQVLFAKGTLRQHAKTAEIEAIVRPDNSFVSYNDHHGKTVPIPQIVREKIRSVFEKYSTDPVFAGHKTVVFKVRYSGHVDLYIIKINPSSGITYKFL